MAILLTPEQERRVQAVIGQGTCQSPEEVVDAALAAVEWPASLSTTSSRWMFRM